MAERPGFRALCRNLKEGAVGCLVDVLRDTLGAMSFCRRRTQFGQQHVEVGECPQYGTIMHGQIDNCCKLEHTHTSRQSE